MNNATKKQKPSKPYPDFPLFPHATGRWAKKIKGKMAYFGKWDDPTAALNKYIDERDDLYAGRVPRTRDNRMSVVELVNHWLTGCSNRVDRGEMSPLTFRGYRVHCEHILNGLGRHAIAEDLQPIDFEKFRVSFRPTWGPVTCGQLILITRMLFRYGWENNLLGKQVKHGPGFKKPSRSTLRKSRNSSRQKNGKKMFEAEEIRTIIANAPTDLKAMVLLGVNAALGQSDCSNLTKSAIDFDNSWLNYPRPKTGIQRECSLWPETCSALQDAIKSRPKNKPREHDDLVFITSYGNPWVRVKSGVPADAVTQKFGLLLCDLDMKRGRRNFYSLRHSFLTIAEQTKDAPAIRTVMGHVDESMAACYREDIERSRLIAVTDHVRNWLFPKEENNNE